MRSFILIAALALGWGASFCQTTKPARKQKKADTLKTEPKPERVPFVVSFGAIFKEEDNGEVIAKFPVKINYYMINAGSAFPFNGSIGGVSLNDIKGKKLLIDTVKGIVIYKGYIKR